MMSDHDMNLELSKMATRHEEYEGLNPMGQAAAAQAVGHMDYLQKQIDILNAVRDLVCDPTDSH